MSFSKKLQLLRAKPRRVRERYIFFVILLITPILLVVWYLTFDYSAATSGLNFFRSMGGSTAASFNNPLYKSTFSVTTP